MSLEYVCNEDMTVSFSNNAGPPDIVYTGDVGIDPVSVVPTKSTHCKALNKYVCTQSVTITWSAALPCPHTSATHTFVSGAATIAPSTTKVKADTQLVLRVGDASTVGCIGSWTNNSTGATVACSCGCEISDAGQDKVKAQ